jgi:hypothetical protein
MGKKAATEIKKKSAPETKYPNYAEAVKVFEKYCAEKKVNANVLPWPEPKDDNQKNTNAFEMIKLIAFHENGGKICDGLDTIQWKHYPWFRVNSGSGLSYGVYDNWRTGTYVPARLCFLDENKVEPAAKRFKAIYDVLLT